MLKRTHSAIKSLNLCCPILLILISGIVLQSNIYISHDVSWHILIAKRLFQGGTYTNDLMDISPPAIMYSKMPIIWLMETMSLSMPLALRIYMFLLSSVSLLLCWKVMNVIYDKGGFFYEALIITLSFTFLCLPLYELGQRDNMVLVLTMPWFFAYQAYIRDKTLSLSLRTIIAISAGIGFLIHMPYFLIYLGFEGYSFYKKRKIRVLENSIILLLALTYVFTIIFFTPDYVTFILPLVSWIYIHMYNQSWTTMLLSQTAIGAYLALFIFVINKKYKPQDSLSTLFACLLALFCIDYILSGKLWYYHMLPTLALTLLLLTSLLNDAIQNKKIILTYIITVAFLIPLAQFYTAANISLTNFQPDSQRSQLINFVQKNNKGKSIYLFSQYMWPHLVIPYLNLNIASRMAPSWLTLGIINKRESTLDAAERQKLRDITAMQFKIISEDLLKYKPAMIMVENSSANFIKFFQQDPHFRAIWMNYHYLKESGNFSVYITNNAPQSPESR
jgi:hypothetical protein